MDALKQFVIESNQNSHAILSKPNRVNKMLISCITQTSSTRTTN